VRGLAVRKRVGELLAVFSDAEVAAAVLIEANARPAIPDVLLVADTIR
jgi:hypothetical protein